jgi:DNA-directed RNA polymerase
LTFAEARPLGNVGLRWMKIHLANVFGNNKVIMCVCVCAVVRRVTSTPCSQLSFDERVAWTEARIADGSVARAANVPLDDSNEVRVGCGVDDVVWR